MNMKIMPNGYFSANLDSSDLAQGLRPTKRLPRNNGYMITCIGAVGRDKVLQVIDDLTRLDTSIITDGFPYPQIFVLSNMTIVCGSIRIYELVDSALVLKLTLDEANVGSTWTVVDFFDYVYMSNAKVTVIRGDEEKTYTKSTELPIAMSICNFKGQVLLGAPSSTFS